MRIMYDGSDFHGWQRQKNAVSVQEIVENSLSDLTKENITVTGCSRTDAGVHALDYVFNFHTETKIPVDKLPYALNHRLGDAISAVSAWEVEDSFNARFSSNGKQYIYRIWNSRTNNPFMKGYSWHIPYDLNVQDMLSASKHFLGTHDFAGFMATGGDQKTTIRTIRVCNVERNPESPQEITIIVEADAFLYNMVRIISGTLAEVGFGKIHPENIPEIISSCNRTLGGLTAPPQGLFLKKVYF